MWRSRVIMRYFTMRTRWFIASGRSTRAARHQDRLDAMNRGHFVISPFLRVLGSSNVERRKRNGGFHPARGSVFEQSGQGYLQEGR